jgi:hypothetical protein
LGANGEATIVQDELKDTYQLAKTTRRPGPRRRHRVSIDGNTHTVPPATPGTVEDHGTVKGAPFGRGSIVLVGSLAGGRLDGTFRLAFRDGSVTGTVLAPFTISGGEITFRGTATLTAGTGAYRGISARKLQVLDHNTLDGQNGVLSVKGFARY